VNRRDAMTHKEATELVWAARSWFRQKSSSHNAPQDVPSTV
jgi:hypothetical protein